MKFNKTSTFLPFRFLIVHLGLSLSFFGTSFGQEVIDLGQLSGTNVFGETQNNAFPPSEVFNGISNNRHDGWIVLDTDPKAISWDVNPFGPLDALIDKSTHILEFTLNIHTGISFYGYGELNKFSLSVADEGADFISPITDFISLSSEYRLSAVDKAISVTSDASGLITATDTEWEDGQVIHSIVFQAPSTTRKMQLESAADGAGPSRVSFSIEEIQIFASAIPVPEPSAYALLLGLGCLGTGIIRKKRSN